MVEEWRVVLINPKYQVSNMGRVKGPHGRLSKLYLSHNGYLRVGLCTGPAQKKNVQVHRLVAEAFIGRCPAGNQASHLDGNQKNNYAENIAWETPKANHARKILHGTAQIGEKNPLAKLTDSQAREIKKRLTLGEAPIKLAREFKVHKGAISQIKRGVSWKHV